MKIAKCKLQIEKTRGVARSLHFSICIFQFAICNILPELCLWSHFGVTDDGNGFAAFREGFDFIDDEPGVVSALEPANVPIFRDERTDWEPIQPIRPDDRWDQMISDRDGDLIMDWHDSARIARRTLSGQWIDIDGLPKLNTGYRMVQVDANQSATYILDADELWNSAVVYRLDGTTAGPPRVILPGCYEQYLNRWLFCLGSIFAAWLLHLGILAGSVGWFKSGLHSSLYVFGDRQVTLATTPRRAVACFADLALLLTVVLLLVIAQSELFGFNLKPPNRDELCRSIFEYDWRIYNGGFQSLQNHLFLSSGQGPTPLESYLRSIVHSPNLLTMVILNCLLLLGLRSFFEGRFGITPGKWLLGIRTVRTSLRPCGFASALVRSSLYWVDIPFFMTPIPAALSLMLSSRNQRIGDRIADTLVVNIGETSKESE